MVDISPTKIPVDAKTGGNARVNDDTTYSDFQTAVNFWANDPQTIRGVGFVLTEIDGLTFIDFDTCDSSGNPLPDHIKAQQWQIISELNSYTEWSPGNGWHVILKGELPEQGRRWSDLGIEMYSIRRYMTMTGNSIQPFVAIEERSQQLLSLYNQIADERQEKIDNHHRR